MREIVDVNRLSISQKKFDLPAMAKLINEGYQNAEGRPVSDRNKTSFAPSSIGYGSGTCARRWFYDFNGGWTRTDDTDTMSLANMAYGTDAHGRIQNVFSEAGILIEDEKEIDTRESLEFPPIHGYADLLINWQGKEVVGEIKTTTQESFVSKKAKNAPAGYHLLQVLIYMKVLGLDTGFLLYENKNTQHIMVLPIYMTPANEKFVNSVFDWMRLVHNNWQDNQLPKRPYTEKSIACKSCVFKVHCWTGDDEGVVMLPRLDVPK